MAYCFLPVMASVYILYSSKLDRYYTGSCKDFQFRYDQHLEKVYPSNFTTKASDWQLFLLIEDLSYMEARAIERRIKSMKSRTHIQNMAKFPEMITKLRCWAKDRFSPKTRMPR